MKIDASRVNAVLRDCLYENAELSRDSGVVQVPADAVIVQGVMCNFGLHPGRLQSHAEEIKAWLAALPKMFRQTEGGGWSFLQACMDSDGVQWGEHNNMDELLCLGMGLGFVK